jgi:hypothetical protein
MIGTVIKLGNSQWRNQATNFIKVIGGGAEDERVRVASGLNCFFFLYFFFSSRPCFVLLRRASLEIISTYYKSIFEINPVHIIEMFVLERETRES